MHGGNSSPYREGCGGDSVFVNGIGGKCGCSPFQHFNPAENGREKIIFNAQVPNWNTDEGGSIDPYERFSAAATCDNGCGFDPDNPDNPYAPCTSWIGDPTMGNFYDLATPPPVSWQDTGETVDFSTCFKYGFKNVQARRQWHGQPGYFFNQSVAIYECPPEDDGVDTETPMNQGCVWQWYQPYLGDASQTKYLTIDFSISYVATDDAWDAPDWSPSGEIQPASYSASGTISVDPTSGVIVGMSFSGDGVTDSGGFSYPAMNYFSMVFMDAAAWMVSDGLMGSWLSMPPPGDDSPLGIDPDFTGCSSTGGTAYRGADDSFPGALGWTMEISAGDGSLSLSHETAVIGEWSGTQSEHVDLSDSSLEYGYAYGASATATNPDTGEPVIFNATIQISVTATLSGANISADVVTDAQGLLGLWDMTDDAIYPWRTDSATSFAPLVSRNEAPGNVPLVGALNMVENPDDPLTDYNGIAPGGEGWTPTYGLMFAPNVNATLYDGSVLGAPLPAGYEGFFDFRYEDWQTCLDEESLQLYGELVGWGQKNTGQNGIPKTATQWTTNQQAWQYPGGAWMFYNLNPSSAPYLNPGEVFQIQKWAEIYMPWASQNFARPAGVDKFSYDETEVYNIYQILGDGIGKEGAQVQLQDPLTCEPVEGISTDGIWGGPGVNGFYEMTWLSDYTYTLGTKIYDVPSDWASKSRDDDSCFGKLRWPDSPAILGRAGVSAISLDASAKLTTDTLTTLGLGTSGYEDAIDIYNKTMTLIVGGITVTRVDDSHFTVPLDGSTLQNAAWICSHGAAAWYWDDDYSKGDFAYTDWTWNTRPMLEANRNNALPMSGDCPSPASTMLIPAYPFSDFNQQAGCIAFTPCSPAVLCISPNGEEFPNGITYDMPTSMDFDEGSYNGTTYGTGWQAEFHQTMEDALWQSSHYPAMPGCTGDFQWVPDNGSCQADTDEQKFYARAPLVECRLTVPDGAPALPSGITLGWESPVGYYWDGITPPTIPSDTLFPQNANGYGLAGPENWSVWFDECGCIEGGGRFAVEYSKSVKGCA